MQDPQPACLFCILMSPELAADGREGHVEAQQRAWGSPNPVPRALGPPFMLVMDCRVLTLCPGAPDFLLLLESFILAYELRWASLPQGSWWCRL